MADGCKRDPLLRLRPSGGSISDPKCHLIEGLDNGKHQFPSAARPRCRPPRRV